VWQTPEKIGSKTSEKVGYNKSVAVAK